MSVHFTNNIHADNHSLFKTKHRVDHRAHCALGGKHVPQHRGDCLRRRPDESNEHGILQERFQIRLEMKKCQVRVIFCVNCRLTWTSRCSTTIFIFSRCIISIFMSTLWNSPPTRNMLPSTYGLPMSFLAVNTFVFPSQVHLHQVIPDQNCRQWCLKRFSLVSEEPEAFHLRWAARCAVLVVRSPNELSSNRAVLFSVVRRNEGNSTK